MQQEESVEPDDHTYKRSEPPLVMASREVVLHHRRLHSEECPEPLGGLLCPCQRSMAAFCLACGKVIYLLVERDTCGHASGLARMISAPVTLWPSGEEVGS
jgi:hypothetical protein